MRSAIIPSIVFALTFAFAAAADPIFPPLVSGEYAFGIRTAPIELDADGVPTRAPTRSVGVRQIGDASGTVLSCTAAAPDEVVSVSVSVTPSGDRAELRGFAFAEAGCTGPESEASENGAYVFFTPPARPSLELPGPSALLPVRLRPPEQMARLELSVSGEIVAR